MTTTPNPHEAWDELAAAYALHALDAAEREVFLDHLADCAACQDRLGGFELVTAQLGWLAEDADEEESAPPTWSQIRPAVIPAAPAAPAVTRARWPVRVLALAAGVIVAAAAATVVVTVPGSGGGAAYVTTVAACQRQPGCHTVRLEADGRPVAAVLVSHATVRMVNQGMTPAPAGRMYVLWQLPRNGAPVPVMGFTVLRPGAPARTLARPYGDTAAFAVSEERAGPLPASPSRVLAIGAAA